MKYFYILLAIVTTLMGLFCMLNSDTAKGFALLALGGVFLARWEILDLTEEIQRLKRQSDAP